MDIMYIYHTVYTAGKLLYEKCGNIVASDEQHLRYSELHRKMPKATDKMLAQQLRELEKDSLINRVVYPVVPPKTEYSLTEYGKTLAPILDALCDWGENYLSETQNSEEG